MKYKSNKSNFTRSSTYKVHLDLQPLGIWYFANENGIQRNNYLISICQVLMQKNAISTKGLYERKDNWTIINYVILIAISFQYSWKNTTFQAHNQRLIKKLTWLVACWSPYFLDFSEVWRLIEDFHLIQRFQ